MLRIYRPTVEDAKRSGEAALGRLVRKMKAAGAPISAAGIGPERWAMEARRVAPEEFKEFVAAVVEVQQAMAI